MILFLPVRFGAFTFLAAGGQLGKVPLEIFAITSLVFQDSGFAIVLWTKIFYLLVPNIWWKLPLFFLFDLKIPTKTYKISSQECPLPPKSAIFLPRVLSSSQRRCYAATLPSLPHVTSTLHCHCHHMMTPLSSCINKIKKWWKVQKHIHGGMDFFTSWPLTTDKPVKCGPIYSKKSSSSQEVI